MKNKENALLAKMHVMYSRRLSDDDYSALASMKSNEELFSYLRNTERYGRYLQSYSSVTLTSGRLESIIKLAQLEMIAAVCKLEMFLGESLYKYFIERDEIEMILYCARYLDTDTIDDLFKRPDFFAKRQTVSAYNLQKATSFDQLYSILRGSPYQKLVGPLISHGIENTGLAPLESVLFNYIYENAAKNIKEELHGKDRDELLEYIRLLSDMKIIEALYRTVAHYPSNSWYKSGVLVTPVTAFSDKEIKALYACDTTQKIVEILNKSVYGKQFRKIKDFEDIDRITDRIILDESIKNVRYTQNPLLCVFSYHTLAEHEVKNLTHIIEGIKYGLSSDEILKILVKGGS
ncbi:MAG: V-type ATPase subunit [Clostridiales bacterium]|nr:V-type ATPase subunit [Clostridiales bacterium]